MKTAMQQAIELVKKYDNREIQFKVLLYNLQLLQEKEKEQIIKAYEDGADHGMDVVEDGLDYVHSTEYFNQTYNK